MAIDALTVTFINLEEDGDDFIYSIVIPADEFNDYVTTVGGIEGVVIEDAGPQDGDDYPVQVRCSKGGNGSAGARFKLFETFAEQE